VVSNPFGLCGARRTYQKPNSEQQSPFGAPMHVEPGNEDPQDPSGLTVPCLFDMTWLFSGFARPSVGKTQIVTRRVKDNMPFWFETEYG
jgi:hypothetical protein